MDNSIEKLELDQVQSLSEIFIKSGFFPDITRASQGVVKILAGRELGLSPIQAMTSIYVIPSKGGVKIQLSGNLIASKIKQNPKYDYRVIISDNKECEIYFYQDGELSGKHKFTIEDAQRAGLTGKDVWKSYTRDMLFNRCIAGGYKQYCPDIFSITVYSEADEIEVKETAFDLMNSKSNSLVEPVTYETGEEIESLVYVAPEISDEFAKEIFGVEDEKF